MRILRATLVATLLALTARAQELRTLSQAEMHEDLFLLTEKLTSLHGGLHRYSSAEEIDETFGAALLAAEERPRDVLWFYREACALVARVRCGHTHVQLGERDRAAALIRRGLLPCELLLAGERAWIARVLDDACGLEPGQELLAVDGLDWATIRARAFARMSGDGFVASGKERALEADFAETFVLLVAEAAAGPYELRLAGVDAPVHVAGLAPEVHRARRTARPERPLIQLDVRPADGVALLTVSAFGDRGEPSFLAQLEASFRRLREEEIPHLVLDLRGNGGGRDEYGAKLVSYLTAKPFGYFEHITVTPDYQGSVRIEERDGKRLMLSHPGLAVQPPAELHFAGDVCILIDGFTFSTAADVATVAHANELGTFFGEETGGGYEGNNSGDSGFITLPNSSFSVSVPHWNYRTAGIGPDHHGRGVEPDVPCRATIADVLAGRDVVLERALAHLETAHLETGTKR